jgi:hypothetical protein
MKHPLPIAAAAAAALIASAGIAAAANADAMSASTSKAKAPAAMHSDIILTAKQDTTIWRGLSAKSAEKAPGSFKAAVGADLPTSVALHAFPQKVADNILTLAGMNYAKLNGKVLVVRTRDRKIESIITPASAKS